MDDSNQVKIEKKQPKWATKLLQDVKSNEKGKIGTRSSNMGSENCEKILLFQLLNQLLLMKQLNMMNGK